MQQRRLEEDRAVPHADKLLEQLVEVRVAWGDGVVAPIVSGLLLQGLGACGRRRGDNGDLVAELEARSFILEGNLCPPRTTTTPPLAARMRDTPAAERASGAGTCRGACFYRRGNRAWPRGQAVGSVSLKLMSSALVGVYSYHRPIRDTSAQLVISASSRFAAGLPVRTVGPQFKIGICPWAPVMVGVAPRIGGRNSAESRELGKALRSRGICRVGLAILLQQRDDALHLLPGPLLDRR